MEPEAVVSLLDFSWFYLKTFENDPSPPQPNPNPQIEEIWAKPAVSRRRTNHNRSKSDQLLIFPNAGANVVSHTNPRKPNLQTITSGREIVSTSEFDEPEKELNEKKKKKKKMNRKGTGRFTKSLSELEFEEIKGFMDLGFVFAEEDKEDPSLVEMIPGLQQLGLGEERRVEQLSGPRARPYLSEAWAEQMGLGPLMMEWKIPAVKNEIDMKDSLKLWAHNVASAVR